MSNDSAMERKDYEIQSYLPLEVHGSGAYQIAFIVRLLQGRRSLVSHHGRTVRDLPFAGS